MIKIPAVVDNNYIFTLDGQDIYSLDNSLLAKLSNFPLIRVSEVRNKIEDSNKKMKAIPIRHILESIKKAAEIFKSMDFCIEGTKINRDIYTELVSRSTGLPKVLIEKEIDEIVEIMNNLESIISVQVPGGSAEIFDNNFYSVNNLNIGYYPAGKSLTIKIPGNVPTICIYWLIPFAQKRPIILIPPTEDPFTHFLIYEAIRLVNPTLASCITFLPCNESVLSNMLQISEQIMISESLKEMVESSPEILERSYFIHYGRSKFVVTDQVCNSVIDAIYRRMTWNCGRTCTGLTSVIVKGDAKDIAYRIAEKFISINCNSDFDNSDIVPLFNLEKARKLNDMIQFYVQKGEAVDVTEEVSGCARFKEFNGMGVLLPTVLLVTKKTSEVFGLELPFPFITVIDASDEEEIIEYAKNTLILSVKSEDKELIGRLCNENTILKVFCGEHIERGYNYYDPHEGYIADFTYMKKAVLC